MERLIGRLDPLAVWGAALSTLLAVAKFWEMWKGRTRIEVSYSFAGDEAIGNEIIIRNLAATPILITYWELRWLHRSWFRWKQSGGKYPEEAFGDLKLGGHSSTKIVFREEDHFDWGASALGNRKIFIRLHIAGKTRPVQKKVYG